MIDLKDRRILLLIGLLVLAALLAYSRGIHFGIEFSGGTRLPISLERPVDPLTMSEIQNNLKNRLSTFGLQQVLVKSIGESEVFIDLPSSDPQLLNRTIALLQRQGKFEGIVDGQVAVNDRYILPGSIRAQTTQQGNVIGWEIDFAVDEEGARNFAEVVQGKANYPVYMFLDRPDDSVILLTRTELLGNSTLTEAEALQALNDVLRKGDSSIPVFVTDDWNTTLHQLSLLNHTRFNKTIISNSTDAAKLAELQGMGFTPVLKPKNDMVPDYSSSSSGGPSVSVLEWRAVNLLSAPVLNPSITEGRINRFYRISGSVPSNIPAVSRADFATNETKTLRSILTGGALPVHIIIGTPNTIPAPLGAEFLRYSLFGALGATLLVVAFVSVRYRDMRIAIPILITSLSELALLVLILGAVGSIDLGTMAGIIGAIGVGVDAQIVITDEMLQKTESTARRKLGHAFYIIMTNAIIAVIAMVPLLFSNLQEVIGFAVSTILGMFIGALVTRQAYGAMLEGLLEGKTG